MIIYLMSVLIMILKLITGIFIIFQFKSKLKKIEVLALFLLSFDLFIVIVSMFTNRLLLLQPFFLIMYGAYWISYILYMILISVLLIMYTGLNDNFRNLHRILLSVYFLSSITGFLILI